MMCSALMWKWRSTSWATFSYEAARLGREGSHGWDHCGAIEDNPWRNHFGSVCGGRPGRGETRRRPGGHWKGGRTKGGRGGGGGRHGIVTSPAGALAHWPCCHTNGGTICVGLKDRRQGRGSFFFWQVHQNGEAASHSPTGAGAPIWWSHSDVLGNIMHVDMLRDNRNRLKLNKAGLAGAPIWWSRQMCTLYFFFLQCRTSTRHGRSTTGNGKDW